MISRSLFQDGAKCPALSHGVTGQATPVPSETCLACLDLHVSIPSTSNTVRLVRSYKSFHSHTGVMRTPWHVRDAASSGGRIDRGATSPASSRWEAASQGGRRDLPGEHGERHRAHRRGHLAPLPTSRSRTGPASAWGRRSCSPRSWTSTRPTRASNSSHPVKTGGLASATAPELQRRPRAMPRTSGHPLIRAPRLRATGAAAAPAPPCPSRSGRSPPRP